MVPFPFMADAGQDPTVLEGIAYLTNILVSEDDHEQRVQLRSLPRRTVEFTAICDSARAAQYGNALLYGGQAIQLGVPLWQWVDRLTALASPGATSLSVLTAGVPWKAGDGVFLWADPFTYELLTLQTVGSNVLNLTGTVAGTWPSGSIVVPMRAGRLGAETRFTWDDLAVGDCRPRFLLEPAS